MPTTERQKTETEYIEREYGWMVGKTVKHVRILSLEEIEDLGWYVGGEVPFAVFFTDGTYIVPMRDEEGNGPGALLHPER